VLISWCVGLLFVCVGWLVSCLSCLVIFWLFGPSFDWLVGWWFGWLFGRDSVLLYLSITTLTQQPSLFAEDMDSRVDIDYDKVRKTANGKEYVLPTKFTFEPEPHGMTIHLENLFNGNKLLGK